MDAVELTLRVVMALGVVLLVLWAVQRRMLRNSGATGATADALKVITRRGLGQKSSVVVIETAGKRFLLGVTEQNINVLHQEAAPADTVPTENAASFQAALTKEKDLVPPGGFPGIPGVPAGNGASFAGSILSPQTWKQAMTFVKGSRG